MNHQERQLKDAVGKMDVQLELAKIRLNNVGYRPPKAHMQTLVNAAEKIVAAYYENERIKEKYSEE